MSSTRTVAKSVLAIEQGEGVGVTVRRSIGTAHLRNFTPFLMLDHFRIAKGSGFAEHPHRGQTTVTLMRKGQAQHEDFRGHKGILNPGDMQWMQAGRGMVHSEMPIPSLGQPDPEGLQLWVNLPAANKLDEPDYQELKDADIPRARPEPDVEVKIISGRALDKDGSVVESPVRTKVGCWYLDVKLNSREAKFSQQLPKGWNAFAYILEGKVKFGGEQVEDQYHTVVLSNNSTEDSVLLESASEKAELVLIAGERLDQEVVQYGPFVMDSQEGIQQAFRDYRSASNGFEGAHDWVSDSAKHLH